MSTKTSSHFYSKMNCFCRSSEAAQTIKCTLCDGLNHMNCYFDNSQGIPKKGRRFVCHFCRTTVIFPYGVVKNIIKGPVVWNPNDVSSVNISFDKPKSDGGILLSIIENSLYFNDSSFPSQNLKVKINSKELHSSLKVFLLKKYLAEGANNIKIDFKFDEWESEKQNLEFFIYIIESTALEFDEITKRIMLFHHRTGEPSDPSTIDRRMLKRYRTSKILAPFKTPSCQHLEESCLFELILKVVKNRSFFNGLYCQICNAPFMWNLIKLDTGVCQAIVNDVGLGGISKLRSRDPIMPPKRAKMA